MTISNGLYATLPDKYKSLLTHIKELNLSDINDSVPWFDSGDVDKMDAYAWFLQQTVANMNIDLRAGYTITAMPPQWDVVAEFGVTWHAIASRINQFVEEDNVGSLGLPYADQRDFVTRWQPRAEEMKQLFATGKKQLRLMEPFPIVVTVDNFGFFGYSQIPVQWAGMPTWFSSFFR